MGGKVGGGVRRVLLLSSREGSFLCESDQTECGFGETDCGFGGSVGDSIDCCCGCCGDCGCCCACSLIPMLDSGNVFAIGTMICSSILWLCKLWDRVRCCSADVIDVNPDVIEVGIFVIESVSDVEATKRLVSQSMTPWRSSASLVVVKLPFCDELAAAARRLFSTRLLYCRLISVFVWCEDGDGDGDDDDSNAIFSNSGCLMELVVKTDGESSAIMLWEYIKKNPYAVGGDQASENSCSCNCRLLKNYWKVSRLRHRLSFINGGCWKKLIIFTRSEEAMASHEKQRSKLLICFYMASHGWYWSWMWKNRCAVEGMKAFAFCKMSIRITNLARRNRVVYQITE